MFFENITFLDAAKPIGVGPLATCLFPKVAVAARVGPAGAWGAIQLTLKILGSKLGTKLGRVLGQIQY